MDTSAVNDVLEQASAWLEEQRTKHCFRTVTYQRGEQSVQVSASIGQTTVETDNGAGATIRSESKDYLILAADLTLGLPRKGIAPRLCHAAPCAL